MKHAVLNMILVKRCLAALFLFIGMSNMHAQDSPAETAKAFIRQGDYNNAILVLNRALEYDKNNLPLKKDLVYAYYLQRDYTRALEAVKPVIEGPNADVQSFQLAGMVYEAVEDPREAERVYRAGLRKYPSSGVLLNEYGEALWARRLYSAALKQWEKGIQQEPNYPGNYYNAAKYFFLSTDKVWGLIYGEMFVNLESYSRRTPEIKTLLLEGYKKLFADADLTKNQDDKNPFAKAFLSVMSNHAQVVSSGITPDALSALRTRFLLEWFDKHAARFPFRLFDYHKQLARMGMFDAYNQWIFGAAGNLSQYQQWTVIHAEEYNRFANFQKNRVFKLPELQYYRPSR